MPSKKIAGRPASVEHQSSDEQGAGHVDEQGAGHVSDEGGSDQVEADQGGADQGSGRPGQGQSGGGTSGKSPIAVIAGQDGPQTGGNERGNPGVGG